MSAPPLAVLAALDAIPPEHIPAAIVRLAARAMERPTPPAASAGPDAKEPPGRLLTAREAAARLGVTARWVYRHAGELAAKRLSERKLRISERALERYLTRHDRR